MQSRALSAVAVVCAALTASAAPQSPGRSTEPSPDACLQAQWTMWMPAQDGPFAFDYRSANGQRPPNSPFEPYCVIYQLRNRPGRISVRVNWLAVDKVSELYASALATCQPPPGAGDCAVNSSRMIGSFSNTLLPSLLKFGRVGTEHSATDTATWQRRPGSTQSTSTAALPILSSAARGVILDNEKMVFEFDLRAHSSAARRDGGWEIVNEILPAPADPDGARIPKTVTIGNRAATAGQITLSWVVPGATASGRRATTRAAAVMENASTRLEIAFGNDVRFAMAVPAYVPAAR